MIDYETIVDREESLLKEEFNKIDNICFYNSNKVLKAFKKNNISENCFNSTTGYGYSDIGREAIEKVYADIFKTEDALVRTQFVSGSHTLTVCLFALLRPNDILLSISGTPYDTLHEVIGIRDNDSSLKSYGVKYDQIDLVENDFDYDRVKEYLENNKVKVIEIQRSKGYSTRKSISISKIEKVTKLIKEVSPETIIMVDNCYCEFVNKKEVTEVGVDIACGSLIKNLGAGIASNGGYIVGRSDLIKLCGERLTLPGEGKEVGPTGNSNRDILKGLFLAPSVVRNALKTAILTAKVMESFGYEVDPKYNEERVDIVQNIIFHDRDKLIKYCQGIQKGSPIDSNVVPIPAYMPGYEDDVIMASGSFTQGSSIELSCDGPLREPFSAYQQGALTYEYGKLGLLSALMELDNE
ncbi:MAG: methionine gamma-lyase family protein [Bacilli bacterium]|nr:methionine gamma-lyase family protein [Bacilli bacterium]